MLVPARTPEGHQRLRKLGQKVLHLQRCIVFFGDLRLDNRKPEFIVGDTVRISKYKRKTFDKGYTPNWTEEVLVIDEIQHTNLIT